MQFQPIEHQGKFIAATAILGGQRYICRYAYDTREDCYKFCSGIQTLFNKYTLETILAFNCWKFNGQELEFYKATTRKKNWNIRNPS